LYIYVIWRIEIIVMKIFNFIKEAIAEFKKVQWPTRKQTIRLTVLVIAASVLVGLFISGADYLFTEAIELLLK